MKNEIQVYMSIDNAMLSRGFESILEKLETFIKVEKIANLKSFSLQNYLKLDDLQNVLICDFSLKEDNIHLILRDIHLKYPDMKTIVLLEDFNLDQAKLLFNLGVFGVINKNIEPEDFIHVLKGILDGSKCLSPKFKDSLIQQFCQKDEKLIRMDPQNLSDLNELEEEEHYHMVEQMYGITNREKEILYLICEGKSTREISEELYISLHTVETHRRNLINKLDVKNTAEMVKVALTSRLISA